MTEPVFIVRGFSNDGSPEPAACINRIPMNKSDAVYQDLTPSELREFGDNLTLFWEAEFDGEGFDLIRPIEREDVLAFEADEVPF